MSRFTRFSRGKIWFVDIGLWKKFDIFHLWFQTDTNPQVCHLWVLNMFYTSSVRTESNDCGSSMCFFFNCVSLKCFSSPFHPTSSPVRMLFFRCRKSSPNLSKAPHTALHTVQYKVKSSHTKVHNAMGWCAESKPTHHSAMRQCCCVFQMMPSALQLCRNHSSNFSDL